MSAREKIIKLRNWHQERNEIEDSQGEEAWAQFHSEAVKVLNDLIKKEGY